ncbi:MAG TPA: substrate-binding domain-containing protein [Actinomycetes bacterium]|nr:substrate-binding domain-containing protein [Actinomycetes bacterium]
MRKRSLLAVTALAVAAVALAACSSSSSSGSSGGSSAGTSAAASTGTSTAASGASLGKVGVILPDTKSSARWENNDRPSLKKAFDAANIQSDIQNAEGDVPKFGQICDAMITEQVKVLIIVNLDSQSGTACLNKAKAAGIKTIDYDRLTLGGGADYYVSFDNVKVGELQGQGLIKCLTDKGVTKANIVYINGAATDNNAALFKQGYVQALKAKIASGAYKLVGDQSGNWDPNVAQTVWEQFYTAQKGNIQGAIVANDGMGGGVAAAMAKEGVLGKIPFTGQDATDEGLQRVLLGQQCVTVFKNTNLEAALASKIAIALINGQDASSIATSQIEDTQTKKMVAFAAATPVAIFKDNVKVVIDSGYTTAKNVCTGAAAAVCTQEGIS